MRHLNNQALSYVIQRLLDEAEACLVTSARWRAEGMSADALKMLSAAGEYLRAAESALHDLRARFPRCSRTRPSPSVSRR